MPARPSVKFPFAVLAVLALSAVLPLWGGGCATLRTTDPPRTATEQFLINVATERAVEQLNLSALQDRSVFLSGQYIFGNAPQPTEGQSYVLGEVRAAILRSGGRISNFRDEAEVIAEVRVQALGIDRLEYIFGFPGLAAPGADVSGVPVVIPELALLKNLKQKGYSAVALVAYFRDTGELVTSTPVAVGRTRREDYWIFGVGPQTTGDIPPAQE